MTSTPLANLRNLGIISHIDAGKTTVSERLLFYTGEIHRMGEVHDGSATMDWMEQEQERGITITATSTTCHWGETTINLIDTPGHIDFTIEVERSLRVLDGALVIFSAVEGVQPQSESVWRQADRYRVPRICLINKLDRVGADHAAVLTQLRERLHAQPALLQLPVGFESGFSGVIDLLTEELLTFGDSDQGRTVLRGAIPADLREAAVAAREQLIETVADNDDALAEEYLEGRPVTAPQLRAALRRATLAGRICPVLLGAALRNKGMQPVLDAIRDYLPSPLDLPPLQARSVETNAAVSLAATATGPLCALAFKVVADEGRKLAYVRVYSGELHAGELLYNANRQVRERGVRLYRMHAHRREQIEVIRTGEIAAIAGLRTVLSGDTLSSPEAPLLLDGLLAPEPVVSLAIEARGADDREKLGPALEKLQWEDPTFRVREDAETGQTILAGMGELHLEVMIERLRREYGVAVQTGRPQVVYRETIAIPAEVHELFQREADGRQQCGEVRLRVEPLERGSGLQLAFPAVETWTLPPELRQVLADMLRQGGSSGVLAGYPLVDVRIIVLDAPFSPGLTTESGVRAAAQRGLVQALRQAQPTLLEPIMALEVTVPSEYAGRVLGSLQQKRGRIEGLQSHGASQIIRAQAPLGELFGFMTELRSASKGYGTFSMEFAFFDVAGGDTLKTLGLA